MVWLRPRAVDLCRRCVHHDDLVDGLVELGSHPLGVAEAVLQMLRHLIREGMSVSGRMRVRVGVGASKGGGGEGKGRSKGASDRPGLACTCGRLLCRRDVARFGECLRCL